MTLKECTAVLAPFALACRADMDEPTFKAYHRILADVPAVLLDSALEQLSKAGCRFLPSAPEMLIASEAVRRQQLAFHKWTPCVDCEDSCGWRERLVNGVNRMERCPCIARHQAKLAELQLLNAISVLPGEASGESEQVFPTLEQLPTSLRQQLASIAGRKVMR